jgi:hypothetical protein
MQTSWFDTGWPFVGLGAFRGNTSVDSVVVGKTRNTLRVRLRVGRGGVGFRSPPIAAGQASQIIAAQQTF